MFTQSFPTLFITSSMLLGISVIMATSIFSVKLYKQFSKDRRQFGFYFTALSVVALLTNISILVLEFYKAPQWCDTEYVSDITSKVETGCDAIVILELLYQSVAVLFSLIAALLIFNSLVKTHPQLQTAGCFRKTRYVIGFWMVILLLGLLTWSIIPSILLLFVYPSIVLSLSALIFAALFWSTVMFSVPLLFFHNFQKNPNWWAAYQYFIRLGTLLVALLMTGLMTVCYLSATVFGSGVGGIVSVSIAIIPSVLLTLLSENYRDWVLTSITERSENSTGTFANLHLEHPKIFRSKSSPAGQKNTTSTTSTPQQVCVITL